MTSGGREGRPLPKLIALSLFVNDANVGPRVVAVEGVCVKHWSLSHAHVAYPLRERRYIALACMGRPAKQILPFVRRWTRDHVKPGVRPACGLLRLNYRVDDRWTRIVSSFWKRPVAKVSKSPKRGMLCRKIVPFRLISSSKKMVFWTCIALRNLPETRTQNYLRCMFTV